MSPTDYKQLFNQIHEHGAKCFPLDWYKCNARAVDLARKLDMPYDREDIKCLLSGMVFSMLSYCRPVGLPDNPTDAILKTIRPDHT